MSPSSGASTYSSSMQSIGNQIGYKVRNIAHYGQPQIEINLDHTHGTHGGYITSYSTMDTIEGTVNITAHHDTRFEDVEIAFIGTSHVYVDRLTATPTMSGRTEASHRFLTLKQPIREDELPCPRTLTAGKTYTFPFTFTVPTQLLPRACPHQTVSDHVRETHLMLPPSMGDPSLAGFAGQLLDDLAPEMSKIIYGIRARVTQGRDSDGSITPLANKFKKVRIKPAFEEQPPLSIDHGDQEYRIRQEKVIKKGLFKGKLGTLTAQTLQPKPLVIPGARTNGVPAITTMTKVVLRFDPADEQNAPPRLGSLASKIKVSTFYASAPRHNFPTQSSLGFDLTQGFYSEHVSLSTLCIASAQWKRHASEETRLPENDSMLRRDSGISDCSTSSSPSSGIGDILEASKNYRNGTFYTASIVVPISLPTTKNFLPTFHSCLISRIYALSLHISAHTPGISDPSLHLKVPIQICAEGSDTGKENARARSAEQRVVRETDELFVPRSTVSPPTMSETEGMGLPPEYAAFAPTSGGDYRMGVSVVA